MPAPAISIVDSRQGSLGEWLFAPATVEAARPLADGLLTLTDRVLPIFEQPQLFAVSRVAIRPIGGPDATYASLAETIAAVDSKLTSLPRSEASIEVRCNVQILDGDTALVVEHGALIAWRWIGEPVIQVKVYCDAFVPKRLDGSVNPIAPANQHRLAAALNALQTALVATVEVGDDEMPWTTANGFYLERK